MYTRCPECDSAHVLNAVTLAHSRGTVRCGRCGQKFDALEQLFDEWPDTGDTPPPAGTRYRPPVLGSKQELAAPFGPAHVHFRGDEKRGHWLALSLLLALGTLVHLGWTFRADIDTWPQAQALLQHFQLVQAEPDLSFRDTGQLHVVSRDLHAHPTRAGVLVLSATFVNHAERAQSWPVLELTLLDLAGKPVARRDFTATEYLPGRGSDSDLLRSRVHVPVLLEFASPGERAVGFEIRFL